MGSREFSSYEASAQALSGSAFQWESWGQVARVSSDTLRMLVISHDVAADVAGTQTGHLIPWAHERGVTLRTADAVVDAELPTPLPGELVAVLGSAQAAFDDTKPWIAREREWLRRLYDSGTAILGICFGAQQLSMTLGGTVSRGRASEFGWTDIEPCDDQAGVVGVGPWFSFHDDVFTVPEGAHVLAVSPLCPQAFRIGRSLAVQFHPEFSPAMLPGWLDERQKQLDLRGGGTVDVEAITAATQQLAPASIAAAYKLFDSFVRAALD
jgi:GMP synthase (glutamine-hydrolysing)